MHADTPVDGTNATEKPLEIGTSTSAYQIEGAVTEDGRGPSIWDTFCRVPGAVRNGDSGDVATDHYHRVEEDLDLLAWLGVDAYRFSIAWPRVLPSGAPPVNQQGLDFYRRLVHGLRERGIDAFATLYHWDLPQALQDQGGWTNRDTAGRFADYAAIVGEALGDHVRWWGTINEPWVVAHVGHHSGRHAPGVQDDTAAVRAAHHLLLAHGLAAEALRSRVSGDIGIVLNSSPVRPASDEPDDRAAAHLVDGVLTRWWLDALTGTGYPDDVLAAFARVADLSAIHDGDLDTIARPLAFLGLNYYSPKTVAASGIGSRPVGPGLDGLVERPPRGEPTTMGWEVDPTGLAELLRRISGAHPDLPLLITENGAAYDDPEPRDGAVDDPARVDYLRDHLRTALEAVDDGVDLRGYFVWSLLDNFEWADGYAQRFGIVHVDYDTLERTPKRSAHWLRDRLRERRSSPG